MNLPLFTELLEVTIMRPSEESYFDVIDAFVSKHKLEVDGGGHADIYMPLGKPYVWRAWTKDLGYESFLKYIERNSSNPHLPKVLSRVREEPIKHKGVPHNVTLKFVKLERLTPLRDGELHSLLRAIQGSNQEFIEQRVPAVWRNVISRHKSFFATVRDLIERGADDIGHGNVMMRGEVPVIIDPVHSGQLRL